LAWILGITSAANSPSARAPKLSASLAEVTNLRSRPKSGSGGGGGPGEGGGGGFLGNPELKKKKKKKFFIKKKREEKKKRGGGWWCWGELLF